VAAVVVAQRRGAGEAIARGRPPPAAEAAAKSGDRDGGFPLQSKSPRFPTDRCGSARAAATFAGGKEAITFRFTSTLSSDSLREGSSSIAHQRGPRHSSAAVVTIQLRSPHGTGTDRISKRAGVSPVSFWYDRA
jgi:hypothetical protein